MHFMEAFGRTNPKWTEENRSTLHQRSGGITGGVVYKLLLLLNP
jgi:hypothetical protein